jgi:hypothetical protein
VAALSGFAASSVRISSLQSRDDWSRFISKDGMQNRSIILAGGRDSFAIGVPEAQEAVQANY